MIGGSGLNVIFWDTETNGLENTNSVLSISAIKCSFIIEGQSITSNIVERYERFYFRKPGERLGLDAIKINGLTDEIIKQRRGHAEYPDNFCNDLEAFCLFCEDAQHFVGHNIFFDMQYLDFRLPFIFCTMKANTKIIGLRRKNGQLKYPSLGETANFYGIEIDKNELHSSMNDSFVTYQIFCKMLEHEKSRKIALDFLARRSYQ